MRPVPLIVSPGRILANDPADLRLVERPLPRHIFIAGGSGNGKSKMLELLCRQLISKGWGFTFIDPHGDVIDTILSHLAAINCDGSRVHHLRPSVEGCFSFDPFAGLSDGPVISYEG